LVYWTWEKYYVSNEGTVELSIQNIELLGHFPNTTDLLNNSMEATLFPLPFYSLPQWRLRQSIVNAGSELDALAKRQLTWTCFPTQTLCLLMSLTSLYFLLFHSISIPIKAATRTTSRHPAARPSHKTVPSTGPTAFTTEEVLG
jgi:hypothetical protein